MALVIMKLVKILTIFIAIVPSNNGFYGEISNTMENLKELIVTYQATVSHVLFLTRYPKKKKKLHMSYPIILWEPN